MKWCVYRIVNSINGKFYLGKTGDPVKRWNNHLDIAKRPKSNISSFSYIHKAIRKYGFKNFTFEVIERLETEAESLQREIELIAIHKPSGLLYNLTDGGDGVSGHVQDKKQRRATSKRMKGKFKGENNPFYGKKHSKETLAKLSIIMVERHRLHPEKYRGENHSHSKLTDKKVKRMLYEYFELNNTQAYLANKYNLSPLGINSIISGRTWSHIAGRRQESKKIRLEKSWNKIRGCIETTHVLCATCKHTFIYKQRKLNVKSIPKYCSHKCLYGRYQANKKIKLLRKQ